MLIQSCVQAHCGKSPQGLTVGFYGFGGIAQKVVERLLPLAPARILYAASRPRPFTSANPPPYPRLHDLATRFYPSTLIENVQDLATLAAQSDVLICLAPLTAQTRRSIGAEVLQGMKKDALLVNFGRGPIVDSDALADALERGQIAGAALDVLEGEPSESSSLLCRWRAYVAASSHCCPSQTSTRRIACSRRPCATGSCSGRTPPRPSSPRAAT